MAGSVTLSNSFFTDDFVWLTHIICASPHPTKKFLRTLLTRVPRLLCAGYLGSVEAGKEYDACELVKNYRGPTPTILIDQVGLAL